MTKVAAQITQIAAWVETSPTAMNCAEPEKTNIDMLITCSGEKPWAMPSDPKMIPKGRAPIISGKVSRKPCQNSWRREKSSDGVCFAVAVAAVMISPHEWCYMRFLDLVGGRRMQSSWLEVRPSSTRSEPILNNTHPGATARRLAQ